MDEYNYSLQEKDEGRGQRKLIEAAIELLPPVFLVQKAILHIHLLRESCRSPQELKNNLEIIRQIALQTTPAQKCLIASQLEWCRMQEGFSDPAPGECIYQLVLLAAELGMRNMYYYDLPKDAVIMKDLGSLLKYSMPSRTEEEKQDKKAIFKKLHFHAFKVVDGSLGREIRLCVPLDASKMAVEILNIEDIAAVRLYYSALYDYYHLIAVNQQQISEPFLSQNVISSRLKSFLSVADTLILYPHPGLKKIVHYFYEASKRGDYCALFNQDERNSLRQTTEKLNETLQKILSKPVSGNNNSSMLFSRKHDRDDDNKEEKSKNIKVEQKESPAKRPHI